MVRTIIIYKAKIWSWERSLGAEIQKLQVKFLKWTLGLDKSKRALVGSRKEGNEVGGEK